MRFRFLGTGTSVGVPQIGCACKVCTSSDPRDRRRRCGAYVSSGSIGVLVDTPPEMRLSCCEYGITRVDAVVLTHAHMDHVAGFDDVRRFNTLNGEVVACSPDDDGANGRTCRVKGKVMPCYAMRETEEAMHRIFPYISAQGGLHGLYRPQIEFHNEDEFDIGGGESALHFERLPVEHGFPCCGYKINGALAYISDCHILPESTLVRLQGIDTLILNCLRERQHPTHLTLAAARSYVERVCPRRAYLIHMCHDFTHREWLDKLAGTCIEPAFDGELLEVKEK